MSEVVLLQAPKSEAPHLPPWAPRAAHTEWRALREHRIHAGEGVELGDGTPVLLVGGFGAPARAMQPLREWLGQLGYDPHVFCWHTGLDCGERTAGELVRKLDEFSDPPVIIAHSRGGQFARVAARRSPDRARALITLGSPFIHLALRPLVLAQAAVLTCLGTAGVPDVVRLSCVRGECCAQFRRELGAVWDVEVPFFSIYSTTDKTVRTAACRDPSAVNTPITTSHVGMLASVESYQAVADALKAVSRWAAARRELGWDSPGAGLDSRVPTLRDRLPADLGETSRP